MPIAEGFSVNMRSFYMRATHLLPPGGVLKFAFLIPFSEDHVMHNRAEHLLRSGMMGCRRNTLAPGLRATGYQIKSFPFSAG